MTLKTVRHEHVVSYKRMTPKMNGPINILLVDDHLMFTDGLTSILRLNPKIGSIENAPSAERALTKVKNRKFDLIISDIGLPGMNGITLVKKLKTFNGSVPILILSMHLGKELVKEILAAGAEGYLLKKANKEELFRAIDNIAQGGTYYGNEITLIMKELINRERFTHSRTRSEFTQREQEILQLICQENSSKEIADKLCIGVTTVETHRRSMFQKTNSKNVIGLIRYAVENNLTFWG